SALAAGRRRANPRRSGRRLEGEMQGRARLADDTGSVTETLKEFVRSFWTTPGYEPYAKPALTDDLLTGFEGRYGVRLPVSMVALLRRRNGGYIDWTFSSDETS